MSVNSLYFLLFLAALYLLYYVVCPLRFRWVLLLAASVLFYVTACGASPVYILVTGVCAWGAAGWMDAREAGMERFLAEHPGMDRAARKTAAGKHKKQKKRILTGAVILILGLLIVLKYGGFFTGLFNRLLAAGGWSVPVPQFLVPLGISYYTLIAIGYLFDVYKGKVKAQKNFLKFMLFLSFFPQMTQGPISRYGNLGEQLYEGHSYNERNLFSGCQRILWGFFKKLVIADRMQPMVQTIFEQYESFGAVTCFLGCVYMTVWMYADFSGYMDIVAGAAELFGIRLEENFKQPFFSASLAEYWRRWHITLSSWFRDYMFYPLAISSPAAKFGKWGRKTFGARVGKLFPSLFALGFVWFSTGLWHDASIRYILWGVANGCFIMGAMILEPWFQKLKKLFHIRDHTKGWRCFCVARTFLLVCALKIFPGSVSTGAMFRMMGRMVTQLRLPNGWAEWFPGLSKGDGIFLAMALVLLFVVDRFAVKGSVREWLDRKGFVFRWACYGILLVSILCMGAFGTSMTGGFAYAQY